MKRVLKIFYFHILNISLCLNIFLDDRHLTNITKFGKKSKNQKKKKKKKKKKINKKKNSLQINICVLVFMLIKIIYCLAFQIFNKFVLAFFRFANQFKLCFFFPSWKTKHSSIFSSSARIILAWISIILFSEMLKFSNLFFFFFFPNNKILWIKFLILCLWNEIFKIN